MSDDRTYHVQAIGQTHPLAAQISELKFCFYKQEFENKVYLENLEERGIPHLILHIYIRLG